MLNRKIPDEDLTKTDDTTISSSSSKKYKKKRNKSYPKINYSITNPLSSIKETNNSLIENEESFCLLSENIDKEKEKYIKIEESSNDKEPIYINDTEESVDNSLKKNSSNKKKEKSGKNTMYKKKEENFIDLDIANYCYSKASSKNKIDLKFLDEEEKEEEKDDDSFVYVQKANDEEDKFKIIYEFNKLPFKPKSQVLDLSIFDSSSILKVIIKYYFEKKEQNFIIKFDFIYISNQNNSYNSKEIDELIKKNLEIPISNNENTSEEKEGDNDDILNDNDTLEITLQLKRFKLTKGTDRNGTRRKIKLRKVDIFEKFKESIEIREKEDLFNYKNFHKIFYTLTIQKNIFIKSKKFFTPDKIGIQNEGNTCYMNSIIQSLYNNQFILKKIMQIDTDKDEVLCSKENDKDREVIIALQNIFYNLYTRKKEINIVEIFYAFNWKRNFWNSPQDAEEIYILIYEIISKYNNEIKDNCEGILENTIEVEEINYKSTKEENFFFMQLDLEKNNSVDECLEHFFESEKLNGDNKYQYVNDKGEKILYDAEKYYKFKKIPNFLFLQLKRFTFDTTTFTFQKKNKAISYKEEIDLTKYLHFNKTKSKRKKNKDIDELYVLYCILIHSGSAENGHYYCIARDFQNKVYIKYNDTTILTVEKKEVFNELFGGEEIEYSIQNINKDKPKLEPKYEVIDEKKEIKRNAYILIYVKKNKIKNLFNENDIKEIFNAYAKKNKKINKNGISFYYKDKDSKKNKENYMNLMKNKNFKGVYNKNRITYPKKINSLNKYDFIQYKEKINKNKTNNNAVIDMKINDLTFEQCISDFKELNNYKFSTNESKKRNMDSIKNSKRQYYSYVGDNSYNSRKIFDKIQSTENTSINIINDKRVYFYLIPDISKRIKGIFSIKYNTNIYVKDIVGLIKEQLTHEKNTEESQNILEKITKSEGYKLALVNSFGFFINFLEDDNYDITKLLNQNTKEKLKHLCLYNFKQIKNGRKINNLIAIHFMKKSLMEKIINKDCNIYDNYAFENLNVPAFIINEAINDEKFLIDRIKDLYVDYFGNLANKNIEFKIYIIKGDILDLNVLKINYLKLDRISFFINCDSTSPNSSFIHKYNITRLLVGI